jgi:hypothetical protein
MRKTILTKVGLPLAALLVLTFFPGQIDSAKAAGRLRMRDVVTCNTSAETYVIRWRIKEYFPGTVAHLVRSSRPGTWHGQWDWVRHPYTYTQWLWMEESVPGDTQGGLQLALRIVWKDADTDRVRDRGAFRHTVSLAGDCGAEEPTPSPTPTPTPSPSPTPQCDSSYPTVCIPPPPPDLDCSQIAYTNFAVAGTDPHGFDGDNDGIGCET